jgi:hypothetical protein
VPQFKQNVNTENTASQDLTLELLVAAQHGLCDALNALGGHQGDGLLDHYRFWTASHINRATEGYVYLRTSDRIDASKHLVRPAIEAALRLQAVRHNPELLFRIAFSEFEEDKKWLRSTAIKPNAPASIQDQWNTFRIAYASKYPNHQLIEERLPLRTAAETAGLEGYYDTHYRLYCKFTHGAFRATTGNLNTFENEDTRAMILCALVAVENLMLLGAPAPNIDSLKRRFSELIPEITS